MTASKSKKNFIYIGVSIGVYEVYTTFGRDHIAAAVASTPLSPTILLRYIYKYCICVLDYVRT